MVLIWNIHVHDVTYIILNEAEDVLGSSVALPLIPVNVTVYISSSSGKLSGIMLRTTAEN